MPVVFHKKVEGSLPLHIRHYSDLARLFPRRVDSWSFFQIQARFTGGGGRREDVQLADYSQMENYGYLTRLDRILDEAGTPDRGPLARRELAAYLAARHATLFPTAPAMREVRYLRLSVPVGHPISAHPAGRWVSPAAQSVPPEWVRQIQIVTDREWTKPLQEVVIP
ncbi:MAG: hypothetical protein JNK37_08620 [Verrucomicrobiales bacterium]|nr:hypothetical protein [Verrucomicrobiales bacterium]